MNDRKFEVRDKDVSREIHKLFMGSLLSQKIYSLLSLCYIPAFFVTHIFIPLQVAYALQAIFKRDFDSVDTYVWMIVASMVIQVISHAIAAWAHNRAGMYACLDVQKKVFENYLSKDYEFYSNQHVGALGAEAAQLRDMCSAYSELMQQQVIKHSTIVFGSLIVIGYNAPLLALLTVACMLVTLSYTILTSKYRLKYRRQVSEASSDLSGVLGDALGHAVTVKSFAHEKYESDRLDKSLRKWEVSQLKSWDSFIAANSGRHVLNAITLGVLLLATASLYKNNDISFAIVALVQLYMIRMIATTVDIASSIKEYEQIMGTAHQSMKTMMAEPRITDSADPVAIELPIRKIEFNDVTFRYDADTSKEAISDFKLSIAKGKKIGLVGYSGSGKTTLTKLLLRFVDVSSGSIAINNIDIRQIPLTDLRRYISYVPQEPLLFHRSIYENIAYGNPDASETEVLAAGKMAHIDEFTDELPDGYRTMVGERGIKLSGGQRQRVAIARAILKNAPILVLDEATSALDSRSEQLIQDALQTLMKDKTAIVIAHRLSTINRMDHIVVLNKGKIVESGDHHELEKANGIYAKLWHHQSGGYINSEPTDE